MVNDGREVALPAPVADLINADLAQVVQAVMVEPVSDDPFADRADRVQPIRISRVIGVLVICWPSHATTSPKPRCDEPAGHHWGETMAANGENRSPLTVTSRQRPDPEPFPPGCDPDGSARTTQLLNPPAGCRTSLENSLRLYQNNRPIG
jgi:hypothetical protein